MDNTVALPLITAYTHARHAPRPLKRLLDRREQNMQTLRDEFAKANGAHADAEHATSTLERHR
jgi:deoxyhypusine synthase